MNRAIRSSVFTASLFISSLAFAQVAAPGAAAPAAGEPAAAPAAGAAAKADVTPQQQKIADLIKQLAADDFPTRDAASNELLKLGNEALPALREALKSEDPSIQSYAEYLVPRIEGGRDGR
jgi:HEAT repeat protein